MNVPIEWIKEYTDLPESLDELTSCLTMIGHMLDKSWDIDGERVIDLELRGNRADLFGLYGIAREISAAYDTTLSPLKVSKLPQVDPKSPLIKANNPEILKRFSGLTLKVKPGLSPDFMVKRLKQYGIGSINNIVDITNYVMIETGVPLHAFDAAQIFGKQIIVRLAKAHEHIVTFAGDTIELTPKDIVLSDTKSILAIPLIGSKMSGCTDATREILLEAAVYNQAMVRQSSRRLSLRTEASLRLEKNISPEETMFALARAVNLLIEFAGAEITSELSDYYPDPIQELTIPYSLETTKLITGVEISLEDHCAILESLGCRLKNIKK